MRSRHAVVEFANLLAIGSNALDSILQDIEPAACAPVEEYLTEVKAIARRLVNIGDALAKLEM